MKVAAIQHDIYWNDPEANFERVGAMIADAARSGARLIVLPADFATGTNRSAQGGEALDGPSSGFLRTTAVDLDIYISTSVVVRSDEHDLPMPTAMLADPEGIVHAAPATPPGMIDLTVGSDVNVPVDGVRVTPIAGAALDAPATFWRVAPTTDVFVVSGAAPDRRTSHWGTLLAARAIENRCYVVGTNRVGAGGGLSYMGGSTIIDPLGDPLAQGFGVETMLAARVDAANVRFTRDRNPVAGERRSIVTLA